MKEWTDSKPNSYAMELNITLQQKYKTVEAMQGSGNSALLHVPTPERTLPREISHLHS